MSVMSLASMATSVPVPMAMPTSAWASAGASLMPSPTMATLRPSCCSSAISAAFCSGSTSATTRSMPTCAAMASRGRRVVAGEHDDLEAELLEAGHGRRGARLERVGDGDAPRPARRPRRRSSTVLPSPASARGPLAGVRRRAARCRPTTVWPSTTAAMPWPAIASNPVGRRHLDAALRRRRRRSPRPAGARCRARRRPRGAAARRCRVGRRAPSVPCRTEQHDVRHPRLALGDRAGLVEHDGAQLVRRLERVAVADEHAVLGALAGAHHDRRRRGQAQGAGARDDQHGDEVEQRVVERRRRAEDQPDDAA